MDFKTKKGKASELDWFDFENRMRDIMQELIEPIIRRASEDREEGLSRETKMAEHNRRLEILEGVVLSTGRKTTIFEQINSRFQKVISEQKKQEIKTEQQFEQFRNDLENTNFLLTQKGEAVEQAAEWTKRLESEILVQAEKLEEARVQILADIEKLNKNFEEQEHSFKQFVTKTEKNEVNLIDKTQKITASQRDLQAALDLLRRETAQYDIRITSLSDVKLNSDIYDSFIQANAIEIKQIHQKIDGYDNKFLKNDSFIDRIYPLRIWCMISDSIHSFVEGKNRKAFALQEAKTLMLLNEAAIHRNTTLDRDEIVQNIMNDIKEVEVRKKSILNDRAKKKAFTTMPTPADILDPVEQSPSPTKKQKQVRMAKEVNVAKSPVKQEITPDIAELSSENDEDDEQQVSSALQRQMMAEIQEIRDYINKMKETKPVWKAEIEEVQAFNNALLGEIEEVRKGVRKQKDMCMIEIDSMRDTVISLRNRDKQTNLSMDNMVEMITCLVENAQIQQALESQDDEDRTRCAETNKDSLQLDAHGADFRTLGLPSLERRAMPTGSLTLNKTCLSCQSEVSSVIGSFKANFSYIPTPLIYRHQNFTRAQLISLRGKMLTNCWESVCRGPPWNTEKEERNVKTYAARRKSNANRSVDVIRGKPNGLHRRDISLSVTSKTPSLLLEPLKNAKY